jgi:hypothetical protein
LHPFGCKDAENKKPELKLQAMLKAKDPNAKPKKIAAAEFTNKLCSKE